MYAYTNIQKPTSNINNTVPPCYSLLKFFGFCVYCNSFISNSHWIHEFKVVQEVIRLVKIMKLKEFTIQ